MYEVYVNSSAACNSKLYDCWWHFRYQQFDRNKVPRNGILHSWLHRNYDQLVGWGQFYSIIQLFEKPLLAAQEWGTGGLTRGKGEWKRHYLLRKYLLCDIPRGGKEKEGGRRAGTLINTGSNRKWCDMVQMKNNKKAIKTLLYLFKQVHNNYLTELHLEVREHLYFI